MMTDIYLFFLIMDRFLKFQNVAVRVPLCWASVLQESVHGMWRGAEDAALWSVPMLYDGSSSATQLCFRARVSNYSSWAESSLLPVCTDEVLLEHSYAHSCAVNKFAYAPFVAALHCSRLDSWPRLCGHETSGTYHLAPGLELTQNCLCITCFAYV